MEVHNHETPFLCKNQSIWLDNVKLYISENIDNSALSIADIAGHFHLSPRQFRRKVKKYAHLTPNHLIRKIRLKAAFELLEGGHFFTVNEVSSIVGFKRADYFSSIFEREYGKRPIDFLKSNHSAIIQNQIGKMSEL